MQDNSGESQRILHDIEHAIYSETCQGVALAVCKKSAFWVGDTRKGSHAVWIMGIRDLTRPSPTPHSGEPVSSMTYRPTEPLIVDPGMSGGSTSSTRTSTPSPSSAPPRRPHPRRHPAARRHPPEGQNIVTSGVYRMTSKPSRFAFQGSTKVAPTISSPKVPFTGTRIKPLVLRHLG